MSTHPEWKTQILAQLDEHAAAYTFPVLDNVYFDLILVDLRAYRAADEWALAFQVVALAQGDLVVAIYGYGNRVDPPGVRHIVALARSPALAIDAHHAHLSMDLSGQAFHRDLSTADLAAADISTPLDQLTVLDALRVIAAGTPAPFLLDDATVLAHLGRAGSHLELFVHPTHWVHPEVANDQLPSEVSSFVKLADSLASGVPVALASAADSNLHWSNWPAPE